jgi:hypothetical protein
MCGKESQDIEVDIQKEQIASSSHRLRNPDFRHRRTNSELFSQRLLSE